MTFKYLQVQHSVPENGGIMKFLAVPSADLHVLLIVYGAITSCHWMREKVLSSLIVPFSSDRLSLLPSCAHFIYLPIRRSCSSPRLPHQRVHRNKCRARPGGEKHPCIGALIGARERVHTCRGSHSSLRCSINKPLYQSSRSRLTVRFGTT